MKPLEPISRPSDILAWAKAKKAAGESLPGVLAPPPAPAPDTTGRVRRVRLGSRLGHAGQCRVILAAIIAGATIAEAIAAETGLSVLTVQRRLNELSRSGRVRRERPKRRGNSGSTALQWRLGARARQS
jgi:hypothetical protein